MAKILQTGPVDLGTLAFCPTALLTKRAEEAVVKPECHAAPAVPLIIGDENHLQQVVINLLTSSHQLAAR